MIHQKDLRLGDLVQITVDLPEYKRGDIFVVIDISEVYIGLRSPSESDCRPDMYTIRDHIEGIHLTPEILEKNGFEMREGTVVYMKNRLALKPLEDEKGYQVGLGSLHLFYVKVKIVKYVHELQHILWALGEDANLKI
uniref:hypothetical protein n=1 Tax=Prevotella sp. TaxID=59823 RepID=UPI004028E2E6